VVLEVVELDLLIHDSAVQIVVIMVAELHTEPLMLPSHCSQLVVQEQAAAVQLHLLWDDYTSQGVVMVAELHTEPLMLPSHCYPLVVQEQLHYAGATLVAEQPKMDHQIGLPPPGEEEMAEEGVVHYYYGQQNVHGARMETSSVNAPYAAVHALGLDLARVFEEDP
jgi:hypothetical protein